MAECVAVCEPCTSQWSQLDEDSRLDLCIVILPGIDALGIESPVLILELVRLLMPETVRVLLLNYEGEWSQYKISDAVFRNVQVLRLELP